MFEVSYRWNQLKRSIGKLGNKLQSFRSPVRFFDEVFRFLGFFTEKSCTTPFRVSIDDSKFFPMSPKVADALHIAQMLCSPNFRLFACCVLELRVPSDNSSLSILYLYKEFCQSLKRDVWFPCVHFGFVLVSHVRM
jgi:hypothetical protein